MKLVHVKLKNGQDLIGEDLSQGVVCRLGNPIQLMNMHPSGSFYAQSWLLFSDENSATIDENEILFRSAGNERAADLYNSFFEEINEQNLIAQEEIEDQRILDDIRKIETQDDAEDRLLAYFEYKEAIKH